MKRQTKEADRDAGWFPGVNGRLAAVLLVMASTLVGTGLLHAATYTWDAGGSSDNNMSTSDNWEGDPVVNFLTGGTHDLVFGSAGSLAQPNAGNYSVNSITFTRAFQIGSSESGDGITVGTGGVTMEDTLAGGVLMRYALKLNANTFIANDSSYNFTSLRGFEASSARSITNNGSGTNWIRLQPNGGGLNNNVTLIQDSPNSKVSLEISGSAQGKVEIRKGLLTWIGTVNPASGNIVLGSATAAESDSAMLGFRHNTSLTPGTASGTLTVSQPIVLAGTVGTNTIASGKRTYGGSYAPVSHTVNWTGGVTGGNSLYLENVVDPWGDDHIQFSTGAINMSGDLIHFGAGSGTCTINAGIGGNVNDVVQDSATSKLILGGANAYTGNTEVVAGTLQVTNNASALPSDTSLLIASGAKLDLGVDVTVATLWLDSVQQSAGTYGATGSGADNEDNTYFAGTKVLTVTIGAGGIELDGSPSDDSVGENLPVGTLVGSFSVPSTNTTFTYSLVETGTYADNASFNLTGGSSSNLVTAEVFDYETKASYSIRVLATETGPGSLLLTNTFTIAVNNEVEAWGGVYALATVAPGETEVATLASKAGENTAVTYSVLSGFDATKFEITGSDVLALTNASLAVLGEAYFVEVQAVGTPYNETNSVLVKVTVSSSAPPSGTLFLFR